MKSLSVNISSFWALWILHPNFAAWASLQVWQMLIKKKKNKKKKNRRKEKKGKEISVVLFLFRLALSLLPECQCCSVPPQGSCTCLGTWGVRAPAWRLAQTSSRLRQHNNVNTVSQFLQPHCFPLPHWCINVSGNGWVFSDKGWE